ncbi:M15 family peptidase [Paenibacillus nanensis]|uniref:M15 family peptidase n=1 Tax=Paenibacillus nanensis TaxID=393251 RepID=A0A3A1VI83_9BACL|nr:M15 family peptidase [Paenibacillus nanensis]
MIAAAMLTSRYEQIGRLLPFVKKDVPPITSLHPIVAEKQAELVAEAAKLDIDVVITDGFRSHEEQNALYEKGRTTSGPVVTHVRGGGSYHNYGLAIDFALKTSKGQIIWDLEYDGNRNGEADWMEVVAIAKRLGFSWGGDWKDFKDYPHLQMDFGFSIQELMRGYRPPETAAATRS